MKNGWRPAECQIHHALSVDAHEFYSWVGDVSFRIGIPPDAQTVRGDIEDLASKQLELYPIWVQLKLQSPDGKHPQQTFANTKSHIIRTGTATTPPTHQTALSYETTAPDGGRLELTPQGNAKPALFAAQESPDDTSDSGGGIRNRTRTLG